MLPGTVVTHIPAVRDGGPCDGALCELFNTSEANIFWLKEQLLARVSVIVATLLIAWILAALPVHVLAAETASGDHVKVRWLAPEVFSASGAETVGLYFEVDPQWHVYWRNPGDSGAAPRFDFATQQVQVGKVQWPFPARLPIAHLTNLGYEGNVAYLFTLEPEDGARQISVTVDLEWLVCKVDCIPGFGRMTLKRPVSEQVRWNETDRQLRDRFLAQVPQNGERGAASPWQPAGLMPVSDNRIRLTLTPADVSAEPPRVFPLNGELISAREPELQTADNSLHYLFRRMPGVALPESTGFVVSDGRQAWQFNAVPFNVEFSAPFNASKATDITQKESRPLWLLLLAAFAGGIILNLMPCVFPVLSIKLMGLIQTPAQQRLKESLGYTAGVLVTFTALGALLLALRATGAAIGWGFQLQSSPVVLTLIALFWLMALSFSGVFEFGHRLVSLAGNQRGGSFVTGMLAVFVATPCTGPFMGVALGAAAVLPALSAMLIFLGLGAGLAAPFVLLSLSPALLRRLPKPGQWMETLRQFLAFPLYATVIWLLWVLGRLTGDGGWIVGSLLLLMLTFALWLGKTLKRHGNVVAAIVMALSLAGAFHTLWQEKADTAAATGKGPWQPYDPVAIQQARDQQRPVFIDYTAAWCITCQVNKSLVLDTQPVLDVFERHNVLLIRADWTHHDPDITAALEQLGRNSVPVYAWYAAGASQAELLPQVLQARMIRALFNKDTHQATEVTP